MVSVCVWLCTDVKPGCGDVGSKPNRRGSSPNIIVKGKR